MTTRTVTAKAPDQKTGMSLADLHRFVDDCHQAGLDPDATVKVGTGWRQQIQQLTASGEAPEIEVLHSRGY